MDLSSVDFGGRYGDTELFASSEQIITLQERGFRVTESISGNAKHTLLFAGANKLQLVEVAVDL